MAHSPDPAATVHDQENLISGVAKHFLHKVYGPEGMPWGTKFSELEELAVQIGQAVSRSMIDQALTTRLKTCPRWRRPVGSAAGRTIRASPRTTSRDHHGGPGLLARAQALLPQVSGSFFSLRLRPWGLTKAHYSPHVLHTIVYAGVQNTSFAEGSRDLQVLAGLTISEKQVERLTKSIGRERVDQREREVEAFLALPLMEKVTSPVHSPDLAVVMMDGGRLQILDRHATAAESSAAAGARGGTRRPCGAGAIRIRAGGGSRTEAEADEEPPAAATGGKTRSAC